MGNLAPLAFDLETTGLDPAARITVAGLSSSGGCWLALNTDGRPADATRLQADLDDRTSLPVDLTVRESEAALLDALGAVATERLDGDRHYLCAFNGETWHGGFDLPFLRTACARHGADWPFPHLPYVDVRTLVERFNTGDVGDLVGVHAQLVGRTYDDPFDDSAGAVDAFEAGDWAPLLRHNLADLRRTFALATLADRYVPRKDFRMKNLTPPSR